MKIWLKKLFQSIKFTILHPQWLSNRYHKISRKTLSTLDKAIVLDIGSGNSKHCAEIKLRNHLITLDYPATNKRYNAHPDIFANATHLPVKDESVDATLLLEVAEHIVHDKNSIKEIYRILKPSGKFYFSVPFIYPMHDQPHDYRRYTLHGIRILLADSGFKIENISQHGNSVITALQLINLSILELCQKTLESNPVGGAIIIALAYPLCILINLIALPALPLNSLNASCFGYFIVATKTKTAGEIIG